MSTVASDQPSTRAADDLEAGSARVETLSLFAGGQTTRQYQLDDGDKISWECFVADGYTIDFGAKVSVNQTRSEVALEGRRLNLVGVDKNRVVAEVERNATFHGCLDLKGEHAGCVPHGASAVLVLTIDNSFSFFTGKDVWLRVTKTAAVAPGVQTPASTGSTAVTVSTPSAATASTTADAGKPEQPGAEDGQARDEVRSAGPSVEKPTTSVSPASAGREAAALADGVVVEGTTPTGGSPTSTAPGKDDIAGTNGDTAELAVHRLRAVLVEAVRLCPRDATAVREHLQAAQARLADYALEAAAHADDRVAAFG
eukprot:TRINITY_DN12893_c0_g1_i1.p1 TRINITY_DN12893_c0_g1~~TRINITY_DN12893_c0_g1_i1.p1  ORF type:complete len:332 (-),score=59.56 TRINITY_DN12893_c0_g1_i1:113-1051(-)